MHTIGLTGGIASGKSTVAQFFRDKGVPVLDADILGHRTYDPGTETFRAVVNAFGDDIVTPEGTINRQALGAKVFGKPEEMKKLTDIVWPGIFRLAEQNLSDLEVAGNEIAVVEAAVLFEAGWDRMVDEVWCVVTDPDIAVERLAKRNGLDEAAARARIASQLTNAERIAKSQVVIENNGTLAELEAAIAGAWDALQARLRAEAGREA